MAELIKDYNLEVHYHPRKANVVADALSQKAYQVEEASLSLNHAEVLAHIAFVSDLLEQIIRAKARCFRNLAYQGVNCRRTRSTF